MPAEQQRVEVLKRTILVRLPSSAIETTAVTQLEEAYIEKGRFTEEELAVAMRQLQEQHYIFVHNGWVVKVRRSVQ